MTPKKLVTIIAGTIVLCSAVVITTYIFQVGFQKIIPQSVRFVLTCLLAHSLVKAWTPGRWITIVLMGLAGVGSIIGGVSMLTKSASAFMLIVLGVVYTACVVGLLTPLAARHFSKTKGIEQDTAGQSATAE